MAVVLNNGNLDDHSVGIVAISRHQGWWRHAPDIPWEIAPDEDFDEWAGGNLGIGATRWQRGVQQFTGHTAVLARTAGAVGFVRGFVPNLLGVPGALLFGFTANGHWQDDAPMLGDPTAVSYEIGVTQAQANGFPAWFQGRAAGIGAYSLRGGDALDSFNCVLAAVTVLANFLLDLGGYEPYVEQLMAVHSSGQGAFMRLLYGGFR